MAGKLKMSTKIDTSALKKLTTKLEAKMKSPAADAIGGAMSRFGKKVQKVILDRYDATASRKNARRRNERLRKAILVKGPFIGAEGADVLVKVGQSLPDYARFVEKGIKPSHREQTYQVIGKQSRDSGGRFASDGISGSGAASSFRGETAILSSEAYKGFKGGAGIKLLPRKKAELVRIKRKITIEFAHPGFPAHGFLRAGAIYAISKTNEIMSFELQRMFDGINRQVKLANPFVIGK